MEKLRITKQELFDIFQQEEIDKNELEKARTATEQARKKLIETRIEKLKSVQKQAPKQKQATKTALEIPFIIAVALASITTIVQMILIIKI